MGRPKKDTTQVHLSIPSEWLARAAAIADHHGDGRTALDILRAALSVGLSAGEAQIQQRATALPVVR